MHTYEFELEKEQLERVGPSGLVAYKAINGRNEMLKGIIVNNRPNSMQENKCQVLLWTDNRRNRLQTHSVLLLTFLLLTVLSRLLILVSFTITRTPVVLFIL